MMKKIKFEEKIYLMLKKEINGRACCFLDLPNYFNPGDQLMWDGIEHVFKKLNVEVKYRSSLHFFNPKKIAEGDCILMQGGGNFGDLYYKHQKFREKIIETFPKNKIIILPSTIFYTRKNSLLKSKQVISGHKNLIICARDKNSYKFLQNNFPDVKHYLIPDSAMAIRDIKKHAPKRFNKKVLFLYRTDKERNKLNNSNSFDFIESIDVSDWVTNMHKVRILSLHFTALQINRAILKIINLFGFEWDSGNDIYGLIKFNSRTDQIKNAVKLLSGYELIISTRLHGHILAYLLGIPHIIMDNNYGKNKSFYDTWMVDQSLVYFAKDYEDVQRIIKNKFPKLLNK